MFNREYLIERERLVVFTRFGGDLLSHVLRRSTIGVLALNGRVRDGIGCFTRAMTTKPRKKPFQVKTLCMLLIVQSANFAPLRGDKPGFYWIKSSLSGN